jgi:hypothetical protein
MGVTIVMGMLVFLVGLSMDIITLLAVLSIPPLDKIGAGERFLLFVGGLILIGLGYVMARNLPQPSVTVEEIKPSEAQTTVVEQQPTEPPH